MQLQTDQLHGRAKLGDNRNRESNSVNKKNLTCNIHFFKLFFLRYRSTSYHIQVKNSNLYSISISFRSFPKLGLGDKRKKLRIIISLKKELTQI